MWRPDNGSGCPNYYSLLYSLHSGFLTEPGARLVVSKPQRSSRLCPLEHWCYWCVLVNGVMPGYLHAFWEIEFRSSCLHSQWSYPLRLSLASHGKTFKGVESACIKYCICLMAKGDSWLYCIILPLFLFPLYYFWGGAGSHISQDVLDLTTWPRTTANFSSCFHFTSSGISAINYQGHKILLDFSKSSKWSYLFKFLSLTDDPTGKTVQIVFITRFMKEAEHGTLQLLCNYVLTKRSHPAKLCVTLALGLGLSFTKPCSVPVLTGSA